MTKASIDPPPEKVRIFISSTIEECQSERKQAKKAIKSLNHAPLLFEGAGARSYPPRTLYLSMIHSAHIFVGIYRNEYGWVAPGMTRSGIEDEFRQAMARGMPILIYILKDDSGRSDALKNLLNEVMLGSGLTVSFFNAPSELYTRIRNDIEAEVAKTFHDREHLEASLLTDASSVLDAVLPERKHLVSRPDVISSIEAGVKDGCPVQVYGPAGIGKTVLLAEMASEKQGIYVQASFLTRKDVASVLATQIRNTSGLMSVSYFDAAHAYNDLVSVWRKAENFRIILDDCRDPDLIVSLLKDVGGVQPGKEFIYSTRLAFDVPGQRSVAVPPMSNADIRRLVSLEGSPALSVTELQNILQYSNGNPLFARLYSANTSGGIQHNLMCLETSFWESLDSKSQEILAYVAMSPLPLQIDDLQSLLGTGATSDIFAGISRLRPYVRDEILGYLPLHEHIGETVRHLLKQAPHRHAYYAKRMAKLYADKQDAVSAFFILDGAEDPEALQYASRAAFDAIRHGNVIQALRILESKLSAEKNADDNQEAVMTLLSIAQVKEDAGFVADAKSQAESALAFAKTLADPALILRAREVRASCLVRQFLDPEALNELKELRGIYEHEEDLWSCARLDLEMGALLIHMKQYVEAEAHTRTCLSLFEQVGDEYGCYLARRNLASILSESADNDKEIEELIKGLSIAASESGNLRERAWFCNIMIRKCRRSQEYARAEKYGREAIAIGEKLGDLRLATLNRICLGNVYRDNEDYDNAFKEYFLAAKDSQQIGDRSLEASTSNLIASVHNRMGNADLAIQYATHAIGLVRGTLATTELSDSYVALAHGYLCANREIDAAKAYIDAAVALKDAREEDELFRLALKGLFIFVENKMTKEYTQAFGDLWGAGTMPHADTKLSLVDQLYRALWIVLPIAPRTRIIDLCGLHFRLMFEGIPQPIGRHLFRRLSRELIMRGPGPAQENWRILFPILPLLVSIPPSALQLSDIAELGDGLQRLCPGLSYKPQNDGAAHWVIELELGSPFICSITQADAGADTATASMILALFLKGFESDIRGELATAQGLAIHELAIQIFNTRNMPEHMLKHIDSAIEDQECIVTRTTDPSDKTTPTIVVCREDIASHWNAGKNHGGSMQSLIGLTLVEIVYRLFGGEVDLDSLRPKIVELVRKTLS